MNKTIFDAIEEPILPGKEGFFQLAEKAPQPKDDSFLNSVKDYAKTILKGGIEGVSRLGRIMGPLEDPSGKQSHQLLEEQTEALNEYLPTDEGYVQSSIRRGLKETPTMLAFPGGGTAQTAVRSGIAGFAGEGVKELGGPEWLQTAAELTAFIGPDITKKLLSTGSNKELIAFAKKMGMTDEQIAPLIQSEFKQKWLSKLSNKRGSTQTALQDTKKGLDETYGAIQKSESALGEISEKANGSLINEIRNIASEMPRGVQELIEKDLQDLLNNKITGRSLINFYKDLNKYIGAGSKELSLLKEPIKKALQTISPELAKDFEMVNSLYTKYFPIASRLKPTLVSDLIQAGEALGILGSITTGYYPSLVAILGEKVAKKLAQQMLINPRFQQISDKMIIAMNENKLPVVKKLMDQYVKEIGKTSPETANRLAKLSDKELREFLNHSEKENTQ